jgi:ABC-type Fe3+-hydroxamate transport system substrate-binding protein
MIDALGVRHPPAGRDARIVSLVPSITELVCDLGLAPQLVGRTGFCIHPRATVKAIPKVGGTKDVDLDALRALRATHVIVNVDENRKDTVEAIAGFVPHVIVTHPLAPRDNLALYRLIGGIFGREREAEALCVRFEEAFAAAERARGLRAAAHPLPHLARPVDDGLARHLHRAHARARELGDGPRTGDAALPPDRPR